MRQIPSCSSLCPRNLGHQMGSRGAWKVHSDSGRSLWLFGNSEILCPSTRRTRGQRQAASSRGASGDIPTMARSTTSPLPFRSNGSRGKYSRIIATGAFQMMPDGQLLRILERSRVLQKRNVQSQGGQLDVVSLRWSGGRMNWICMRIGASTQLGTQQALNTPQFALIAALGHL